MQRRDLSPEQNKLFRDPAALSSQSLKSTIKITNRKLHKYNISGYDYQNMEFTNTEIHTFRLKNTKLTNIHFKEGDYAGIFFSDSILTNVTFEDVRISGLGFGDATAINVTFKNCTIENGVFVGLNGNVKFINCTLNAPNFYGSKAILDFENSTITNASNPREEMFRAQKLPAAMTLKDSHLIGAYVGGTLTSFKVYGGSVMDAAIGDTIGEVVFDHAKLDLTLGSATINSLQSSHSELIKLSFGKATIHDIHISDCKKSRLVSSIDTKFDTFSLSNCHIDSFTPLGAMGNHLSISNTKIGNSDMEGIHVGELFLKNTTFLNSNLNNALADHVTMENIAISESGTHSDTGSNIKLH